MNVCVFSIVILFSGGWVKIKLFPLLIETYRYHDHRPNTATYSAAAAASTKAVTMHSRG